MSADSIPDDFHGIARLFPLPNVVLFPGVVQSLHIFEPRYRQMTADALASDGLIALALLRPGSEESQELRPEIEQVVCLGRIVGSEKLPDGRYNLRLRGVARAEIVEELPLEHLYRTARVNLLTERAPSDLEELKTLRRALAEVVLPRFDEDGPARRQIEDLFGGELTLGQVCDVLAYALPLPLELKQAMLAEPDSARRAIAIADAFRNSTARASRRFPPDFSAN